MWALAEQLRATGQVLHVAVVDLLRLDGDGLVAVRLEGGRPRLQGARVVGEHYERTLNIWAANLAANKDAAIAIQSQEVYDRYMKYLTGCEDFFRKGISNVGQFTLVK
ncbi:hypothetical protein A9X05_10160 [Mycobacterium sp. E3298]|nr:hypothetical protein A9X05_10160 [Mycobacterium sp. E3298]